MKKKKEDEEKKEGEEKKEVKRQRYSKFWREFGKNIRLGVVEDHKNRKDLIELLRFYSTNDEKKIIIFKRICF